jgi:hypothetical protein
MRRTIQTSATVVRGDHLCQQVVRRERLNVQQATEADCLTRARDSRCAELSKTRPPSYVQTTLVGSDWTAKGSDHFTSGGDPRHSSDTCGWTSGSLGEKTDFCRSQSLHRPRSQARYLLVASLNYISQLWISLNFMRDIIKNFCLFWKAVT